MPVEVLGLTGVPQAGDTLTVVESEARAREVAAYRAEVATRKRTGSGPASLESMFSALKEKQAQEYPLVIKADVQGTVEAIVGSLAKIPNEDIKARVLHAGVGGITESDVTLARASGAPIIGFNVRANAKAREIAERNGVALKYYDVIYDLIDDVKAGMAGQLGPEAFETVVGRAQVLDVFQAGKIGKAAGLRVLAALNPYRLRVPPAGQAGQAEVSAGLAFRGAGAAAASDPMRALVYRVHPVPRARPEPRHPRRPEGHAQPHRQLRPRRPLRPPA